MMTQSTTDGEAPPIRDRVREWIAAPIQVTRGWLLLSVLIGWAFVSIAIFSAVQTIRLDNRVTTDGIASAVAQQVASCSDANTRRLEAKDVALAALEADINGIDFDETVWDGVDNALPEGLPEPLRTLVYEGLAARRQDMQKQRDRIELTYTAVDCSSLIARTSASVSEE